MATAFQGDAFQVGQLAFQIDLQPTQQEIDPELQDGPWHLTDPMRGYPDTKHWAQRRQNARALAILLTRRR